MTLSRVMIDNCIMRSQLTSNKISRDAAHIIHCKIECGIEEIVVCGRHADRHFEKLPQDSDGDDREDKYEKSRFTTGKEDEPCSGKRDPQPAREMDEEVEPWKIPIQIQL